MESSSLRPRKVPKPAGGWASRSTSSLSFMIWSRASRRVWASRSFWEVTAASERCVSASRSSRPRECAGRVAQPTAQVGDLGLQEAHLAHELFAGCGPPCWRRRRDVDICVTSCVSDTTRGSATDVTGRYSDGVGHDL